MDVGYGQGIRWTWVSGADDEPVSADDFFLKVLDVDSEGSSYSYIRLEDNLGNYVVLYFTYNYYFILPNGYIIGDNEGEMQTVSLLDYGLNGTIANIQIYTYRAMSCNNIHWIMDGFGFKKEE